MKSKKILIVGAGIAGTALLRSLKSKGFKYIKIIEQAESLLSHNGSGICLPANALVALNKLGLKEKVLQVSHQVTTIEYAKSNGQTLTKSSLLDGLLNKQPFIALQRSHLLSILQDDFKSEINLGLCIASIKHNATASSVTFSNGEVEDFDLIVGADGINSATRTLAFKEKDLLDLNVTNWRFIVDVDTKDIHPTYFIGNDEAFMIYPISKNTAYCYAQIIDKNKQYYNQDSSVLKSIFIQYEKRVQQSIAQIDNKKITVIKGRLQSVISREVYTHNIVLIGDALHGCPPSLQQGVALSLEDAILLTESLVSNTSIEQALIDFKNKRLSRIDWVIKESNKLIKLASIGSSFIGRIIRNLMIRKNKPANVVAWEKLLAEDIYI